jgi:hypothetical protein
MEVSKITFMLFTSNWISKRHILTQLQLVIVKCSPVEGVKKKSARKNNYQKRSNPKSNRFQLQSFRNSRTANTIQRTQNKALP